MSCGRKGGWTRGWIRTKDRQWCDRMPEMGRARIYLFAGATATTAMHQITDRVRALVNGPLLGVNRGRASQGGTSLQDCKFWPRWPTPVGLRASTASFTRYGRGCWSTKGRGWLPSLSVPLSLSLLSPTHSHIRHCVAVRLYVLLRR